MTIDEGFVRHWQRIGPILDEIRRRELEEYDHDANWKIIDSLFEIGYLFREKRTTSGLVELQRKLHRRRHHE